MARAQVVLVSMLLLGASRAVAASLQPLGDLPGGGFYSGANAVSADGSVVVGDSDSGGGDFREAFRWTAGGGMVGLGDLAGGDFWSDAIGVSADGSVVVGNTYSSGGQEPFRWTAGGGMVGGLAGGWATGVSADGSVIVGNRYAASGYIDGFRWTAGGGMVYLSVVCCEVHAWVNAVSGDGSVVVGEFEQPGLGGYTAFRMSAEGMVDLGLLPSGGPSGVSGDGSVVVGTSGSEAFRWTAGEGMVGLGQGYASGVSGNGTVVVGGTSEFGSGYEAIQWTTGNGMQRLWDLLLAQGVDPAAGGWSSLTQATAVSADGNTIVGYGTRNGNTEAFRAFVPNSVAQLPGDFNRDGAVDGADFLAWQRGASPNAGSAADLADWQINFGQTPPMVGAGSLAAAAPEPATAVLFGAGLVAVVGAFLHRSESRRTKRRANHRHAVRRPHFEPLEDRLTPGFAYWGDYTPEEFSWFTGPDDDPDGGADFEPASGQLQLNSADFNADGWKDLFRVTLGDPGGPHLGEIFLSRTDGTLDYPLEGGFDPGPDPRAIATGDFAFGGFDGLADFAIYVLYGHGDRHELEILIDKWYVYRNMGDWPVVGPELPGDFNHDGTVDGADFLGWQRGESPHAGSAAELADWRANFGQTLPMVGAGSLAAAVPEPATAVLFGAGLVAAVGAFLHRSESRRTERRANLRHAVRRPRFEPLEDRLTLSYVWDGIYYSEPPPGVVWAPSLPLLADFTSDGIPDQISANYLFYEVAVRPGRGDGTFGDPISSFVRAPNGGASGVADLNSDGKLDVFVASLYDGGSYTAWGNVLTNSGGGSFFSYTFPVDFVGYALVLPLAIGTGDLFGAGRTDVVVAGASENYDALYVVLANTPDVDPTPGDFDRDGDVDGVDFLGWQRGESPNPGSAADLADWRINFGQTPPMAGAGSMDAAAAVPEPATAVLFGAGLVAVFGTFSRHSQLRRARHRAKNRRHAVRRPRFEPLEQRSMLAFLAPVDYPVGGRFGFNMQAADFNGDDTLDLVTVDPDYFFGGCLSVLVGIPDGTFQPVESPWPADSPLLGSLAVGDFNEDGKLDLAVGSFRDDDYQFGVDDVVILIGGGNGTFGWPVFIGTNLVAESLATGDLNGDDNLDLIVTARDDYGYPLVRMLLGGGDGTFAHAATYGRDTNYVPAGTLADFNGDGNLDLAAGSSSFLGNGDGTFQQPIVSGPFVHYGTTVGDYDGDGNLDLAGISLDQVQVAVLRGNGDGTFQPAQSFAAGSNPAALTAADVNGDSVLDLVVADSGGLSVLLGNGDGSFGLSITTGGGYGASVVVADFNADGRPDAAVANYLSNTVAVLHNDGIWPAVVPALPGDFNQDGAVDGADFLGWQRGGSPNAGSAADLADWQSNYGQTPPMVGAGSLVAAALASPTALGQPEQRGSIEPLGKSDRDAALAVLDLRMPQFIPQGKASMRPMHALPTTESEMTARGNDLRLVRSAAAEVDPHASENGRNSRLINNSTEEAVETRIEALDVAFTILNRTPWQLGGSLLRKVWAGLCVGLVTLALQSWCLAAPQYKLLDLGTFGGDAFASDINEPGEVVGYSRHADGRIEGFRTQPNSPLNPATDGLDHMEGNPPDSYAAAVNDFGQVIGSGWVGSLFHAAFTLSNGQFGPSSDMGGGLNSYGFAINNRGQLVVSTNNGANEAHGFRTSGLRAIDPATDDLGTLGGMMLTARGINELGQVVGGSALRGNMIWHAYRTAPDAPINPATDDLGGLGGAFNEAFAINDIGQVAGTGMLPNGAERAFRTAPGAAINALTDNLGALGPSSAAEDINNSGVVVGYSQVSANVFDWHAFVSFPGEPMADLNALLVNPIPGVVLVKAHGINDSGKIVGEMLLGDGATRAFLLTPVPEPTAFVLCALGMFAFRLPRTRRRLDEYTRTAVS